MPSIYEMLCKVGFSFIYKAFFKLYKGALNLANINRFIVLCREFVFTFCKASKKGRHTVYIDYEQTPWDLDIYIEHITCVSFIYLFFSFIS